MHIEFLVEEPSAEVALRGFLPRILPARVSFAIRVFQGKQDLIKQLPKRLRAYPTWLPQNYGPNWYIVVLLDRDLADCHRLKDQLERIAAEKGLPTRTRPGTDGTYRVINRIVVEELESWFFGDRQALQRAFPQLKPNQLRGRSFTEPDAIRGGTWEKLARLLSRQYPRGMPKKEVAMLVSAHMTPSSNRSHSFQVFSQALTDLLVRHGIACE
ncbi:MAG: DUF4276 family protein [Bacteroidota bacterium]